MTNEQGCACGTCDPSCECARVEPTGDKCCCGDACTCEACSCDASCGCSGAAD